MEKKEQIISDYKKTKSKKPFPRRQEKERGITISNVKQKEQKF